MNKIRLQVVLAKAGIASRRRAATLIEGNRVSVNGKIVNEKGFRIDISNDKISFDGKTVSLPEEKYYYVLNKPLGVVSTARDERLRATVCDFTREIPARLYPVGRLDKNTTGLIIMTNDGDLTYRLTHPRFEIDRVYEVKAEGLVKADQAHRLKNAVIIEGKPARAEKIVFKKKTRYFTKLLITLHEGRKREVRKMFEAIGHPVLTLKRVAYGPLGLRGLKEGRIRPLTAEELLKIKRCVGLSNQVRS